jgi:NitT/TauT family transport system ATP-binding protein
VTSFTPHPAQPSPASIAFHRAGKHFVDRAGKHEFEVLADLSLQVRPAEIVSVLGPSGCGKSSMLNLAAGFEFPTRGSVTVAGREVAGPGPDRAVVFQQPSLFPWLNVFDNVTLGVKSRGDDRKDYARRAAHLLRRVGLAGFERHYPYQLSGGMQQRVQIARALISQPDTLLMDEPFGALDYQTRILMQELLLDLWQEYRPTIFFITHDVAEAIFLSDRVLVMGSRPGRIRLEVKVEADKPRTQDFLAAPEFIGLQSTLLKAVREEVRLAQDHQHQLQGELHEQH